MPEHDLGRRTLELVEIPSESRREQDIADYVAGAMPWEPAWRDGETLWYEAGPGDRPLVVFAGHLDTVPAQHNLPGRLAGGVVHGLGASDMKAGLAVMIELARWYGEAASDLDVGFVFFPREELPATESPLPAFFDATARAREAQLAIVLEPTDNTLQPGCLGHLRADLVFDGVAAHSARPWTGRNAIHDAVRGLAAIAELEPRDVELEGLTFREVLSVTRIEGGIADNVIPDRVSCTLSFRYTPDRSPAEAMAELERLVDGRGRLESVANSPAGRVVVETPLVRRLREAGRFEVEPKQAWTPVAEFSAVGVDAVNLGPGATRYAHKRDEQVEVAAIERCFDALRGFLTR
jgi:succinyl-diaminopimelate desuccinylase